MNAPVLRRFVRHRGKKQAFWSLYCYTANSGYVTISAVDSEPVEIERVEREHTANVTGEIETRVAEKLAEGYVEATNDPWHGGFDSPLRQSLEAALAEDPDDLAAHMAYADHLQDLGDPRGEFIQVQLALENEAVRGPEWRKLQRREAVLLKRHERTWLGPMAGFWIEKMDDADGEPISSVPHGHSWRRGWINSLWFYDGWGGVQAALSWKPLLRCLRELRIVHGNYDADRYGYSDLSGGGFFQNVRILEIGDSQSSQNYLRDTVDAGSFYRSMPRLEELHIYNGDAPFADSFPHLRQLTVYHGRYLYPMNTLVNNASLGNLTHLSLWPRSMSNESAYMRDINEDGGIARISRTGAVSLLRSANFPHLQHLRLRNSDLGDEGLRVLIETGWLKRLKTLDLLGGCVTDAGAQLLAASPDLRHLEALNLSHNLLTETGLAALHATGVSLTAEHQHRLDTQHPGEYLWEGDCE